MEKQKTLRIVIYAEDGLLVAQCLEYDICTQAKDRNGLLERMNDLIGVEMEEMERTGQNIPPAPKPFHDLWNQKKPALSYMDVAA